MKNTNEETSKEYGEFLETLVIEELIKEFNYNCKLEFVSKKRYGGSNITEYTFKDDFGLLWSRDVTDREWFNIACRSPKMRARRSC